MESDSGSRGPVSECHLGQRKREKDDRIRASGVAPGRDMMQCGTHRCFDSGGDTYRDCWAVISNAS